MTVVSLFSGAGGLDLGLIQAGNKVIWANDIDKDAVATYKKNIGLHIKCSDIKSINIQSTPKADVVVGGFPCQGFSQANLLRTIDDDRNQPSQCENDMQLKSEGGFPEIRMLLEITPDRRGDGRPVAI